MNAVDTNVLVYSLDANEPDKQAKAKLLLAGLVGGAPFDSSTLAGCWGTLELAGEMGSAGPRFQR
jgi:hypothetical protein